MATTVAWQYLGGGMSGLPTAGMSGRWSGPHPGRVWLALASCWFVSGQSPVGQAALGLTAVCRVRRILHEQTLLFPSLEYIHISVGD